MHHVLIIEDDESISQMLNFAFANAGFNVDMASNGMEGIEYFNKGNFDLVITDIKMPKMDGQGVLTYIKQSEKSDTPVIGMSGTPWEFQEGFDDVLPKPFSLKTLLSKASYFCESYPKSTTSNNCVCRGKA